MGRVNLGVGIASFRERHGSGLAWELRRALVVCGVKAGSSFLKAIASGRSGSRGEFPSVFVSPCGVEVRNM